MLSFLSQGWNPLPGPCSDLDLCRLALSSPLKSIEVARSKWAVEVFDEIILIYTVELAGQGLDHSLLYKEQMRVDDITDQDET